MSSNRTKHSASMNNIYTLCISSLPVPELKTFEWDILNPDRIINLEI